MKQKLTALALALIIAALCAPAALAAPRVPEMTIDAALQSDGSAVITMDWVTDTDEGTEFYLACNDSGYLTVTDFSVADSEGDYTLVEDWDIDASFGEKARRCGIVETDKGVELCWGISAYGENRYTVRYTLHGLVGAYDDADGFDHRFVDEMSFFPTDVALTIRNQDGTPLTEADCGIWGFGFDGEIQFVDGTIQAWTEAPLESGQHMTVMVELGKGILSPARTAEGSFEAVKDRAFDGSDYDDPLTGGDILLILGLIAGFIVLIALIAVLCVKIGKARMDKRMRSVDYFRDAPNGGDMNVTWKLGSSCGLCRDDALLGAYLLRLISDGALEPVGESDDPKQTALRLIRPPRTENAYDDAFYTVLEAAAGADGVLQGKELERYTRDNGKPLWLFVDSCTRQAMQTLIREGCLRGAECDNRGDLTEAGRRQLDEILGLKRFLLDFSLIHERGVRETVLWQDYMIYALLLGIADRVAPQIKELYPDALPQIRHFERCMDYAGYYNGILYHSYRAERDRRQAVRSSGGGGHVSFGGGGGFSGGGGGGVR